MAVSITGIVFATIVIITDILLICAYIISVFVKKIYLANAILHYGLLHLLLSLAFISWSLVMINNGFDIIWITVAFDPIVVILILFVIGFLLIDTYLRKMLIYPNKGVALVVRVALPAIIVICFSACLVIYYYVAAYFGFINSFLS